MKKLSLLSFALLSLFLSCNAQQTQSRPVTEFNKIQVSGAISIQYTHSDTVGLSIKSKSSEFDRVETKVENSTLVISTKGNLHTPVMVYVQNNKLKAIEASGASDFKSMNVVPAEDVNINASGSANVQLKVNGKSITCLQAGASNITLKGTADTMRADVTGASTLKAFNLTAKNIKVTTTGASTAKVCASETLKANATGASDIKIKGDPKEVSAEASTAANISRIKEDPRPDSSTDTTTYSLKKKKILVISDGDEENEITSNSTSEFKHWKGFSMGVNGYLNPAGSVNMPGSQKFLDLNYSRSFNFQFNIAERHFNIADDYFKVVTGFGFDYHLYEFANRTDLNADTSFTWGTTDANSGVKYLKNKLRCTYLQVPLLLEFNTNKDPDKSFHIALGVIGQYLIASRTKQVLEQDGYEFKKIKKDNYNLSPFAAKAHVNLGYKSLTVFGEYSLTTLFQPGKGPELYPFTVGIRLVPFT